MSSTSLSDPPSPASPYRPISRIPTRDRTLSTIQINLPSKSQSAIQPQQSPEHRSVKRLREATPIYEPTGSNDSRQTMRNASIPVHPTTAAGPSSIPMQSGEPYAEEEEEDTSDNGEGEDSVLFSETLKDDVAREGYVDEGKYDEDVELGQEEFDEMMDESHEDADMAETPQWLVEPHTMPTHTIRDEPSRFVIPKKPPRRPVQQIPVETNEEMNEELDEEMEEVYHSGDSDSYEMDHRPILERTAIKKDIREFAAGLDGLFDPESGVFKYHVVDRLGEGTFSSVYLARDRLHNRYNNEYWMDELNPSTEGEIGEITWDTRVALKKILVTSSPARIENELDLLESLRGCRNVSQLITAFREEDQVIIVLPYHQTDDFRHFYKHIDPPHIRLYMLSLIRALADTHARGIIHRDVKPANFLFDYESGEGVLCDFGLAERYIPPKKSNCQHSAGTLSKLHGQRAKTTDTPTVEQAVYDTRKRARLPEGRVGFNQDDKRPAIKTNRAGTRGFRAPEVLMKCPDQNVSIDVWSAGIILLAMLTHKFPVFNSNDDVEALMEISAVFGRSSLEKCAMLHNRTILSNVPTIDNSPTSLTNLILRLNPHLYTPPMVNPDATDAERHIEAIDQAIDLCKKMLKLDCTTRITSHAALGHPFFGEDAESDDDEDVEILQGTDGKCGKLHGFYKGRHVAIFDRQIKVMRFGQGVPTCREIFCPEHENWQVRFGVNPNVFCKPFAEVRAEMAMQNGETIDDVDGESGWIGDGTLGRERDRLRPAF